LDRVARLELDDRLLPTLADALVDTAPLRLGLDLEDVHGRHLDAEELLDGLADLRLVRVLVHLERVAVLHDLAVALLGDDGRDQDFTGMEAHCALPCTSSSAASLRSSERAHTISATLSSDGTVTTTRSRLRKDLPSTSSLSVRTTTVGVSLPQPERSEAAFFVDAASNFVPSRMPSVPACAWSESA